MGVGRREDEREGERWMEVRRREVSKENGSADLELGYEQFEVLWRIGQYKSTNMGRQKGDRTRSLTWSSRQFLVADAMMRYEVMQRC